MDEKEYNIFGCIIIILFIIFSCFFAIYGRHKCLCFDKKEIYEEIL